MDSSHDALQYLPVNHASPLPFYHQVKEWFYESLSRGVLKPGEQLPSEAELCAAFQVSRTVIRQALNDLVNEGKLYRWKGKGSFVSRPKIGEGVMQKLTSFYQDMLDRGLSPVTQVLEQREVPASSTVAERLGIQPGQPVLELVRLRLIEDEPIVLAASYLPLALCPGLLHDDFSSGSLYGLLAKKYGLVLARGRRTFEAVAANLSDARLLGIELGAPLILLTGVSYLINGCAIEYSEAKHRGDRSRFEVELVPGAGLGAVTGDPIPADQLPSSNGLKTA